MFDQLSERLQGTMSDLRSRGKLSEDDVDKAMREIRLAVSYTHLTLPTNREV